MPWVGVLTWESQTRSADGSRRRPATSPTTPHCGSRAARRSARARRRSSRPEPRSARTPRRKRSASSTVRPELARPDLTPAVETFDQPDSGYPEEGPPGTAPDDAGEGEESAVREKSQPETDAPDND